MKKGPSGSAIRSPRCYVCVVMGFNHNGASLAGRMLQLLRSVRGPKLPSRNVLNGGAGNELMTGGKDPDLFVFNAGFGMDIITAFKQDDHIQFDHGLFPDAHSVLLASQQVGDETLITLDQNNTITLQGVQLSSLQESNFMVL